MQSCSSVYMTAWRMMRVGDHSDIIEFLEGKSCFGSLGDLRKARYDCGETAGSVVPVATSKSMSCLKASTGAQQSK